MRVRVGVGVGLRVRVRARARVIVRVGVRAGVRGGVGAREPCRCLSLGRVVHAARPVGLCARWGRDADGGQVVGVRMRVGGLSGEVGPGDAPRSLRFVGSADTAFVIAATSSRWLCECAVRSSASVAGRPGSSSH